MKKVQLLLMSFVFATMAFSQQAKGDIYLGGSLNLSAESSSTEVGSTNTDGPKIFSFGIEPKVGYFISDKISVGLNLGFSSYNRKVENSGTTTKNTNLSYGGGIFARYYVLPTEKFGFFFEAGADLMAGSSKTDIGGVETDGPNTLNINAGFTPGIVFYVSNRVALEANYGFLGYNTYSEKDDSGTQEVKSTDNSFGLDVNPGTFELGVSVLF